MTDKRRITAAKLSRRERSKADKMRRILAAGEKLFARQGFDGTTVQQIADEADIAVGTLFLYVSDKSELLLRLFHAKLEREIQPAVKRLRKDQRFLPAVKRFLRTLMVPHERDRELATVFWREFLFHQGRVRDELDQQTKAVIGALEEKVRAAQAKGEADPQADATVGALHFYAIFHASLAFSLADCLPGTASSSTLDALLQSAWHGMAPRLGAARRD